MQTFILLFFAGGAARKTRYRRANQKAKSVETLDLTPALTSWEEKDGVI